MTPAPLRQGRGAGADGTRVARPVAGPGVATDGMIAQLLAVDAPQWASFLREVPHDFYHLPAYVALSAAQEHGVARALYVEDGARSLLVPLIVRDIPGSDGRDATSPYGYPGPLVCGTDDAGFMAQALSAGMATLREVGIVTLFVRLHPLLNASAPEGGGEVVLHGDTVSVDLTLPEQTLWAQMRRNHRRDITKAVRSGFVARIDRDFEQYRAFKLLYRATMDRLSASPFYFFGDAYFDALREALGDRLHLCLVEKGDAIAAAGLLIGTGGIMQYHLMGTDEAFASGEPSKLMVHHAVGWAKARGYRSLHVGGGVGGATDSLLHFKAGLSPVRHPYRTLRVVLDEAEYRRLVAACDPDLDPDDLGGYFPAYRAE